MAGAVPARLIIIRQMERQIRDKWNFLHRPLLQSKRFMRVPLTSKLCAEVWRTGYECPLNPGNENSKLEMETPKFPAKIDFNFHWKSSSLQTETSDFRLRTRFSVLVSE